MGPLGILLVLGLVHSLAVAQTCQNYGTPSTNSTCACPPGFGGSTCASPACGGNIFQGSQRTLLPAASNSSSFPNITSSGCACETGWIGTGCNVCQTSSSCQNAYVATSGGSPSVNPASSVGGSQNDTLVCNTQPTVYAAGEMSCQVINPTVQNLFPLSTTLNILRTIQPSLTPIPNATGFGSAGTMFAQLWYAGVEQFYCQANSCTQTRDSNVQGSSDWNCQNLQCTCITGGVFCGNGPANLGATIDGLTGSIAVSCSPVNSSTSTATCAFKQSVLESLFGSSGLTLDACSFGECVRQSVIDESNSTLATNDSGGGKPLGSGVIAGLAVVGALLLVAVLFLIWGLVKQRKVRRGGGDDQTEKSGGVNVEWSDLGYVIPGVEGSSALFGRKKNTAGYNDDKVILDGLGGTVQAGQIMAILGPSGSGKTTLVEILAGREKSGHITGLVSFRPDASSTPKTPRIGFVPQQDILPPMLTVYEALLFAARLRLPETVSDSVKSQRVEEVMEKLGIESIRNVRIGWNSDGKARGISGGEMRRVSIGLELIAKPDVLLLDEPTSGLDSVSAAKVANVLHAVAHDPENPTAVIASIHQPSSQLYHTFDSILLLSHGHSIYCGPGSFAPKDYFAHSPVPVRPYQHGYNIADYLLEVASDPPVGLFQVKSTTSAGTVVAVSSSTQDGVDTEKGESVKREGSKKFSPSGLKMNGGRYATTFLTQFEVLSGREWKILRRDKSLFLTHVLTAAILGVFCGGLYFRTNLTIAGFQSRVGCLFFLGALVAFSSLSALYNIVEIRPLFLRERSNAYYSPTAWLLSRLIFDVVPLRFIPTIVVSTITYWMAGLAHDTAHFFKFLFILVLYTLAMTLFNFLLGTMFRNGGIAILLSALSALYQMTFAGFFVHLNSIPPVLRWLQWICPLKFTLEALSVNEVGSGLMIQDTLQGVPVNVSASLILTLLFGFGTNNYYRDVLILFGFIAAFGLGVIGVVWLRVRERR